MHSYIEKNMVGVALFAFTEANKWYLYANSIYKEYVVIHILVDIIHTIFNVIYQFVSSNFENYFKNPEDIMPIWIKGGFILNENKQGRFEYIELYDERVYDKHNVMTSEVIQQLFLDNINMYERFASDMLQTPVVDSFTLMKYDNKFVSRINGSDYDTTLSTQSTSLSFLTIEYTHQMMTQPIVLNIPDELFVVGNQLFSPAFVYRYLEKQNHYFHFDLNYIIKFIDRDINMFDLRSDQYLLITEKGYEIKPLITKTEKSVTVDDDYEAIDGEEEEGEEEESEEEESEEEEDDEEEDDGDAAGLEIESANTDPLNGSESESENENENKNENDEIQE
jgi:hypothetical protein